MEKVRFDFGVEKNGVTGGESGDQPKMMARTTSITMQNLVEIARRTSA